MSKRGYGDVDGGAVGADQQALIRQVGRLGLLRLRQLRRQAVHVRLQRLRHKGRHRVHVLLVHLQRHAAHLQLQVLDAQHLPGTPPGPGLT